MNIKFYNKFNNHDTVYVFTIYFIINKNICILYPYVYSRLRIVKTYLYDV